MLRRMQWDQFIDWMAFASIEPFDEGRADLRSASICAMLANINRNPKKRPQPFVPNDFLLIYDEEDLKQKRPKQSLEQMKAIGRIYAEAFNEPERPKKRRIVVVEPPRQPPPRRPRKM